MKLLHVVEAAGGGAARHVVDLCGGMLGRGHEVHLLYSAVRSDGVFRRDLGGLQRDAAFRCREVLMSRGPRVGDLLAARALRRYVLRHGPFDLVHCHSTKAGMIGRLALAGSSVACVYTPHGFFSMDRTRTALARSTAAVGEVVLSKLGRVVIAVSREEYRHAISLGIAPAVLRVVHNGVALGAVAGRPRTELHREWGLRDGEVCVGFVGRLVPVKSPETMLRAFAEMNGSEVAARLVMIGDGPLRTPCHKLAAQLGIESKVAWLGEQDAKTMMHAFDMLVLTSESEAAGLVVLEAMARGLPLVATSVGIVPEAVREGVNGFIVPVRDTAAIAGALGRLARDAALRDRMGRMSRVLAQEFSIDRMVDRTVAVYEEVVLGTGRPQPVQEMTAAAGR